MACTIATSESPPEWAFDFSRNATSRLLTLLVSPIPVRERIRASRNRLWLSKRLGHRSTCPNGVFDRDKKNYLLLFTRPLRLFLRLSHGRGLAELKSLLGGVVFANSCIPRVMVAAFYPALPATCSWVIRAARSALETWSQSAALPRANRSSTRAIIPVHPVWWLAPSPAPLSPWKYS